MNYLQTLNYFISSSSLLPQMRSTWLLTLLAAAAFCGSASSFSAPSLSLLPLRSLKPASSSATPTQLSATAAPRIASVLAREILDSRGNPTLEVDLTTSAGRSFRAAVPSGASTGAYEACELRDGDKSRYGGKGVTVACRNVNFEIAKAVAGHPVSEQLSLDQLLVDLDGTPSKSRLGANALLGVSLACARAGADAAGVPLYRHVAALSGNVGKEVTMPVPCFNVINGGSHAGNKLAFQEYFVIPTGAESFTEAVRIGAEVYHALGKIIKGRFGGDATLIGDEGGFAPPCDNREGCELIMEAVRKAGYEGKVDIGLDVAASEFKIKGKDLYDLNFKHSPGKEVLTGQQLMEMYEDLASKYPIVTIEDPFDEDDWENWSKFTARNAKRFQIVGDDLTVTNPGKISRAIKDGACTALLLKVNQIGTLTESINSVKMSKRAGWGIMTSHRSGETEDTFIADLAVGLSAGQIKAGAPCRSERTAKYNQLLRIEEELNRMGQRPIFPGRNFRTTSWMGE